jgi:hypothetical protein
MFRKEGEERLLKLRQVIQHPLPSLSVQLQQNIVKEEEGLPAGLLQRKGGLDDSQQERKKANLAGGGVFRKVLSRELERKPVPVWAGSSEPQPGVLVPGLGEPLDHESFVCLLP